MSVDARQELDLKIGVAFSRLMTRTYLDMAREKFRLKDQKVISYGPCQTPTLWFCVQRHKEIQNFRPQQYFYVSVQINVMGRGVVEFLWADGDRVNSRYKTYTAGFIFVRTILVKRGNCSPFLMLIPTL